ncbi:hypothetical protein [Geobacillus thermodenitrificans]|uniref:hypothetical protein n=1 Tax=Geobacillus thermodenitrificans TaxID=33940 RepID=UPI0012FDD685|nr:hypothetical protein [Geobacillus thermodenitrificans]
MLEREKADRSAFLHGIAAENNFAQILHGMNEHVHSSLKYQWFYDAVIIPPGTPSTYEEMRKTALKQTLCQRHDFSCDDGEFLFLVKNIRTTCQG